MNRDYCACIRTLGKAGEKYQILLNSLKSQTIKPRKILVYIPYGYDLPEETIGIEEYVRCKKGMVQQRALPFDEVDTEWILFLDDDLFIPNDGIEKLFLGLESHDGDCISPDIYSVHKACLKSKILTALTIYTFPRKDDGWAFKICSNGQYTYNNSPSKEVLLSQSAAGACFLLKKQVYQSIHFEDELWMDQFQYAIGDDLLFSYKIFLSGYKLLIHDNTGFVHLDARSGRVKDDKKRFQNGQLTLTVMWYRACYNRKNFGFSRKMLVLISYTFAMIWKFVFNAIPRSCKYRNFDSILGFVRAKIYAYKYIHSENFKNLPLFDEYNFMGEKMK